MRALGDEGLDASASKAPFGIYWSGGQAELDAIVGQNRMDFVGDGLDRREEALLDAPVEA